MNSHLALAIDFGTSRTKVAWRDEQGNVLLLSFGENHYLPSLFYLPEDSDEILLGLDAISAYEDDVLNVVTNPKRMIERNASIRTTQARNTSTQDLLIELFRHIKQTALTNIPDFQGISPEHIVITIPGNAPEALENQLRRAARAVAWDNPNILPEPVAAARYWLHGEAHDTGDLVLVVLDCGGGTTDWACLQRTGERIHRSEHYPPGTISIGGADVDQALCDWLAEHEPELHAARPEPRLRDQLRVWKEAVFNQDNPAPLRIKGKPLGLNPTLLTQIYQNHIIDKVLPKFQLFVEPIVREHPEAQIVLVGGNATEQMLREIQAAFPNQHVTQSAAAGEAVILGALALPGKRTGTGLLDASSQAASETVKAKEIELPSVPYIHGWDTEQVKELQRTTAQALNCGVIFRDKLSSGDFGPEMVMIPAGSFLMGSPLGEPGRNDNEIQHQVTISKPFAIGRYAVTFDEYDYFCEQTGRSKPRDDEGWGRANRPVINVSSPDARAYCRWLSLQTGENYRLPTEAEWEYACRAGTTTPFSFGENIHKRIVRYDEYKEEPGSYNEGPARVDQFPPNRWGLCQMHGNVSEWCQDYVSDVYLETAVIDPAGPLSGKDRVLRGGSWVCYAKHCRSAYRCIHGSSASPDTHGFRLAREHSESTIEVVVLDELAQPEKRTDSQKVLSQSTSKVVKIQVSELPAVQYIHGWRANQVQELQRLTAQALSRDVIFRDSLNSGGLSPEMVVIPAGSFVMGSPSGESDNSEIELQHQVTISKPFALGRYAVTFDEYDYFCKQTGLLELDDEGWGRADRPVIWVTWHDAVAYCKWLSQLTGENYRLPTEAEWEYACRAGTSTPYYFGKNYSQCNENTVSVNTFQPNAWNLYQMHGNVDEWCQDWASLEVSTQAVTDPTGPCNGEYRICRGGSWDKWADCRSAARNAYRPGDGRNSLGFRLARSFEIS